MSVTLLLLASSHVGLAPWQHTWNRAARRLNAGDYAGCLQALPPTPDDPRLADLAYTCAVSASDLSAADRLRPLLGEHYQPRNALDIHHAWMLHDAGRPDDALAALVQDGWSTARQRSVGGTLELTLLAELGRWEEAATIGLAGQHDPRAVAWLAAQAPPGQDATARALLDRACPQLDEPTLWGCASVLRLAEVDPG